MGVPNVSGILILAIADMGRLFVQTLCYAILIQVIISWIQPISPLNNTLYQITSPILRPIQRALPLMAGMDISPIPAMIILQLILIVLINPLTSTGLVYAFN
jgi:YggT family protein